MKKFILKINIIIIFFVHISSSVNAQFYNTPIPVLNKFIATPTSVKVGESITLSWDSSNAEYCTGIGPTENDIWTGRQPESGDFRIYPEIKTQNTTTTYEYKLTCYNHTNISASVGVQEIPQNSETKYVRITVSLAPTPTCTPPETLNSTKEFCINPNIPTYTTKSKESNLFVQTGNANDITQDTAIIYGIGGDSITNPKLPITAYFRYSSAKNNTPIYCNDIYGTNMNTTKDIKLGITKQKSFSYKIKNLKPDTTYYYCAILSNKENIAYGGSSVIKSFHTNPTRTTTTTEEATNISSTSALLNGTYSSVKDIKTYFRYKENATSLTSSGVDLISWKTVGEKSYTTGNRSNINGKTSFKLTGLKPSTKYIFYSVIEDKDERTTGNIVSFKTESTSKTDNSRDIIKDTEIVDDENAGAENNRCPTNYIGTYPNCTPSITCNSPQIYHIASNSCIENTYCVSPRIYNSYSSCDKIDPVFCQKNPTNTICISENEWIKNNRNSDNRNNCAWNNGIWVCSSELKLGSVINPPSDAIVRNMEGIENVFVRQIINDTEMASVYGYKDGEDIQKFAWYLADNLAKAFGYIDSTGKEIRVSKPNIAAYQLKLIGNDLGVYEYYNNKIVDIRKITTVFKNRSDYEYYFKK